MKFEFENEEFTVKQIIDFNKNGKINLNPGFQRRSVWTISQQRDLLESLLLGMPIPTMFFWQHKEGNKVVYDVIDGKQRIESILAFVRRNLPITVKIDPADDVEWNYEQIYSWSAKEVADDAPIKWKNFLDYKIPVVIVSGSLTDIEKLFIKINSTGSKLTKEEILKAKWNRNSNLLKVAEKLANSYSDYFIDLGILSSGQISRMKAVELISELLLSMEGGKVLNKKDALNSVMNNTGIHAATLNRLASELKTTFAYIKKFFPDIKTTRFKKTPDFYALAFCLWKLEKDGYAIKNKKRAQIAFSLLKKMSVDMAKSYEAYQAGNANKMQSPSREYHATVIASSDSGPNRKRRVEIILSLLEPVFEVKDSKRAFSENQKQLLWHSKTDRICNHCKKIIHGWDDADVDHILVYARGGKTKLTNGQLLHSSCNKKLGAKGQ